MGAYLKQDELRIMATWKSWCTLSKDAVSIKNSRSASELKKGVMQSMKPMGANELEIRAVKEVLLSVPGVSEMYLDESEWQYFLSELDVNNDKRIDFREFSSAIKKWSRRSNYTQRLTRKLDERQLLLGELFGTLGHYLFENDIQLIDQFKDWCLN